MTGVLAIMLKELKLLFRDPGGLFLLFVLPAIFILVLSVALQGAFSSFDYKDRMDILVVNRDEGDVGKGLMEALEKSGYFRPLTKIDSKPLDRAKAMNLLARGDFQIALVLPRATSRAIRYEEDATIEVLIDPAISKEFAGAIQHSVVNFVQVNQIRVLMELLADVTGRTTDGGKVDMDDLPGLKVKQVYATSGEIRAFPTSIQQNVPGWTVFAPFWIAQILAINIISERNSGAYRRIMVAPVSMTAYIAGKTAPFFLINLAQGFLMFCIGVFVLPSLGGPALAVNNVMALVLVTAAISAVAIAFGLLMSAMSDSSFHVASVSAAVLIIMTVLGGIMVPKFVMPAFMQKMSLAVPHGWALDAYLDILVRDYGVAQVLPRVGVLLLFALGFALIATWRLKRISRL
ncbi:MAG: ABC transporter permease [Deltaproteobacteria bacterium]|nr:ABC transporter permease [Deltaproteobacteria bacterium]